MPRNRIAKDVPGLAAESFATTREIDYTALKEWRPYVQNYFSYF